MLQHATCRDQPCIVWQHDGSQPGHGISEMINVNDLGQIVRPICAAMRVIPPWSARRSLAPSQHGGNRREEVAPVKAGRDVLRSPLDIPAARACGTALNQLEQAVAGADVPAAVCFENNGWPSPTDAGID